MRLYFSVGEPSGDQHAAMLIQELKKHVPHLECEGLGGPHMKAAGCKLFYELTTLAVMGILKVLPLIGKFLSVGLTARKHFRTNPPDAVVLIDFPGFNRWIAWFAKGAGIPVYYYLPPQLWAWGPWRVKSLQQNVDRILSGLQFEVDWYEKNQLKAEFVGHPFFDEVAEHKLDEDWMQQQRADGKRIMAILPGSRSAEVTNNFPMMLDIVSELSQKHPDVKFLVGNYKPTQKEWCEIAFQRSDYAHSKRAIPLEFHTGKTSEIIELAECAYMVSGSISLELLARKTPAVIQYIAPWTMYQLAKLFLTCEYMTLPNLMAGRMIFPEFGLHGRPDGDRDAIAAQLKEWLSETEKMDDMLNQMDELLAKVGQTGSCETTARAILSDLNLLTIQPLTDAA